MSSALNATGRLFVQSNLFASNLKSNILVIRAIKGARGNAAAKSWKEQYCLISTQMNKNRINMSRRGLVHLADN